MGRKPIDTKLVKEILQLVLNARHYSRVTFHRKYNQWLKDNQQKWEDSYLSHNWVSGQCCQIDYSSDQLTLQVEGVNGVGNFFLSGYRIPLRWNENSSFWNTLKHRFSLSTRL